ncbi:MAG: hypothetical protein ACYDD1_01340, partial [Caulobacteraceae bacterium]
TILWKYAATAPCRESVDLRRYFEVFSEMCFRGGAVPADVDVALERDMGSYAAFPKGSDVYYYQTPSKGARGGRQLAWFSFGGFILYVRFDEAGPSDYLPRRCWMRGKDQHHFHVSMRTVGGASDLMPSVKRVEGDLAKLNAKALKASKR